MSPHDFRPKAILWCEKDFWADRIVQRMTPRQRAMYLRLLMTAYFGSHAPYLLADDPELWLHADADNHQQWEDNKASVLRKFSEVLDNETGQRLLKNNRVCEEWELTVERLRKRSAAGAKSAENRQNRILKKGETLPTISRESTEEPLTPVKDALTLVREPLTPVQDLLTPSLTHEGKSKSQKEKKKEKEKSGTPAPAPDERGGSEKSTQTKTSLPSLRDLTLTETVAEFISIPENTSLDKIINIISDGEYSTNLLDRYGYQDQLKQACLQAVREKAAAPFVGKETCGDIMGRAMEILNVQFRLDAPKPWVRVLKSLRDKKAPASSLRSKKEILEQRSGQVLTDPESALHWYEVELKPFEVFLTAAAKTRKIPTHWGEAVHFLNEVVQQNPNVDLSGLLVIRDTIQARITPAA